MPETLTMTVDGFTVERIVVHYKCPRCGRPHQLGVKWGDSMKVECASRIAKIGTTSLKREVYDSAAG